MMEISKGMYLYKQHLYSINDSSPFSEVIICMNVLLCIVPWAFSLIYIGFIYWYLGTICDAELVAFADELDSKSMDEDHAAAAKTGLTHTGDDKTDLCPSPSIGNDVRKVVEGCLRVGDASKLQSGSRRVAFVSVKNPLTSTSSVRGIQFKETESESDSKEDSFFSLLTAGSTKDSLF